MLNLMTGLNGFTLCSGIICQELNGGVHVAIPLDTEDTMTIGYIKRKNIPLSILGKEYVEILKGYRQATDIGKHILKPNAHLTL